VLPLPGVEVVIHTTRRFPESDVRFADDLPVTLPARAIVDAAGWSPDELTMARLLVAGVQQCRVPPGWLKDKVLEQPRIRRRQLMLLLCNDFEGGAEALSEVEFLAFCRRHGFPRPKLQSRLDSAGRRRYLDAEFRSANGGVFRVEIDGGIHLKLEVRARDDIKDNDARLDGNLVLRYASYSIYTDAPDAIRQIRRGLTDPSAGLSG